MIHITTVCFSNQPVLRRPLRVSDRIHEALPRGLDHKVEIVLTRDVLQLLSNSQTIRGGVCVLIVFFLKQSSENRICNYLAVEHGTSYPKGAKVWYDNAEWISPFDNNTTAPGGQNEDGEDAWIAINDLGGTVGGSGDGDSGTILDLQKIVEELTLLNDNINKNHLNRFSSDDICETFIGEYTMRYTGYVSGTGYFQVNGTQKHDSFKGLTHIRQGTLLYSTQTCYAIYSPQSITFSSIPTVTYGDDFPCKESSAAIVLSETNVNKVTFTFTEEYFSTVQSHRYTDLVLSRITARASQKEIRTNVSFPIYNQLGASYTRTCSCYIWPKQNLRIMISRISNTINGTYYDFYDSSEYLSGLSVSVYEEAA